MNKFDEDLLMFCGRDKICLTNKHALFKSKGRKFAAHNSVDDHATNFALLAIMLENKGSQYM